MADIRKTVYYRRARFMPHQARSLQQLVAESLDKLPLVADRLESVDSAAKQFRVVADFKPLDQVLCGYVASFERGAYQTVIADRPDAKSLSLDAIEPPVKEGYTQQFVPGVLYFAIFGNHVAVVQSATLRAVNFEQHLAWLLRSKTSVISADQGFALCDEPQPVTIERIQKSHVKSLNFGRPLLETAELAPVEDGGKESKTKFKAEGPMMSMLRNLMMNDTTFESLAFEERIFDGNLEVWFEIRHPKRVRSLPDDAIRLLDNLGIAFRNLDDDEVTLKLRDNSVIKGSDLRISGSLNVASSRGILSDSATFEAMKAWLRQQLEIGTVQAD